MAEILTTVYLPSKGKFNEGKKAYAGPIDLDMMGMEEEKLIFGSDADDAVDRMLQKVIKTEGISVKELTPQDKHFLLVKERVHTYGADYHIKAECPICGAVQEFHINIEDIPVLEIADDFSEPVKGVLPLNGAEVGIKLLRSDDNEAIEKVVKLKEEKLNANPKELRYEMRKIRSLVEVDGKILDSSEKESFLRELKGRDLAYLEYLRNKIQFGYSNIAKAKCKECLTENVEIPFVLNSEFFRPRFD